MQELKPRAMLGRSDRAAQGSSSPQAWRLANCWAVSGLWPGGRVALPGGAARDSLGPVSGHGVCWNGNARFGAKTPAGGNDEV